MPLSEYEQRVLEQMERQLTSDDPRLANTLTQRGHRPFGRYVIAGVGASVGLLLLVLGAANSLPWLGVIGFVVMFAAVAFAFAAPAPLVRAPVRAARGRAERRHRCKPATPAARQKSSFMISSRGALGTAPRRERSLSRVSTPLIMLVDPPGQDGRVHLGLDRARSARARRSGPATPAPRRTCPVSGSPRRLAQLLVHGRDDGAR